MKKFISEFRAFIAKGNVLDLAVGVIIGQAFSSIVKSLTNDIIMPLVTLALGKHSLGELSIVLRESPETGEKLVWNYGAFLQSIIDFLIIAFIVFLFVKLITKAKETIAINETVRKNVQAKLDADKPLTKYEQKWLDRQLKKHPETAPKKTPPKPVLVPELSKTDQLLEEILGELKKQAAPEAEKVQAHVET